MDKMEQIKLNELISVEKIRDRISELAREIIQDSQGDELFVIGLLTGSFVFLADLIREFHQSRLFLSIDFLTVSSYGSQLHSSNDVRINHDIHIDITGKPVLLIDDILDTGQTLQAVTRHLMQKKPETIKTCVMLEKLKNREIAFRADYIGFQIPDTFVVGYGLDYDHRFRELPYLAEVSFPEM